MAEFLSKMWSQLKSFFGGLSKAARIRLGILAGIVVVFSVVLAVLLNYVPMEKLYSTNALPTGMYDNDVLAKLEELGIKSDVRSDGIYVPSDELSRAMILVPTTIDENFNYDTIAKASGFAVTSTEQREYIRFQLQEHIQSMLRQISPVIKSSVILNLPEEKPFVLKGNEAVSKASVVIHTEGNVLLTQDQANAIIDTVANAGGIPEPKNVNLTDNKGRRYQYKDINGDAVTTFEERTLLKEQLQAQMGQQVFSLLAPVYGMENLSIVVNADLNWDKVSQEILELEPPTGDDQGVIVSWREQIEKARDSATGGEVGTDANGVGVGTPEYPWDEMGENEYYFNKITEYNLDYNQTKTLIDKAQGSLVGLSIAVIINETGAPVTDVPTMKDLVANAIGIDDDSYITLTYEPFKVVEPEPVDDPGVQTTLNALLAKNILEKAIVAIAFVIILLAFLSLIRALIRGVNKASEPQPQMALADGTGMNVDYIAGLDDAGPDDVVLRPEIDFNVKSENLEQIESFVSRDPQAVAQLLRNWLSDE